MGRFEDKVLFVTGAGKGIGAAVAEAAAGEGAAVALFDVDGAASSEAAARITEAGGSALALQGDVRQRADVERAVAATVAEYGGVDHLAAIAGVLRLAPAEDTPDEDWRDIVETNVRGPFLCVGAVAPHMRHRHGGSIVMAASAMAFQSAPGAALYSASKGAIVSLTHALAMEFAEENIRVNCVAPGTVRTPMAHGLAQTLGLDEKEAFDGFAKVHPMGRMIEAHEVAQVVLFLLSGEASAVTGSCYGVDGGLTAHLG